MNIDMDSMISSYIEGNLNNEDKKNFENYLNKNPEFSKKVEIIKNMIDGLSNQETVVPSENFISNLHSKIPELSENNKIIDDRINSNYWFNTNFKTTLGFSFMILLVGVFFMNRIPTDEPSVTTIDNLQTNTTLLSDSDSLETNKTEFPIQQVKGSSNNK